MGTGSDVDRRGQVASSAARIYDEFFVPALFEQATDWVLDAAGVSNGDDVVDVACGTGVLTRAAAARVGPGGGVVGVDVNPDMLAVARAHTGRARFVEAPAERLPLDGGAVDAAVSQFGLMFFTHRVGALREMARVTRAGGRVAVAVWGPLAATPGYAAMAALLGREFGPDAAASLHAPYCLGEPDRLLRLATAAGLRGAVVDEHEGTARFGSLRAWVHTDIRGWTLADRIDDEQYERLLGAAADALAPYVRSDGQVRFATPVLVLRATT